MKAKNYKFTSDLHFGHKNIMKFCPKTRPYSSTLDMDCALLANINTNVHGGDILVNCGDFFFHRDEETVAKIVSRMPAVKMIWILGNHDYPNQVEWVKKHYPGHLDIRHYLELKLPEFGKKHMFVISHYPFLEWNKGHHGSMMLHGHCHGNINNQNEGTRRLDVGWDSVGKIIGLDEIYDRLQPGTFASHHGD